MTLKIPAGVLAQHVIALGKTRSGKSSKMRVLVEQLLDAGEPVCIIDPKGDWWGIKSSADGKKAGYPIVIFGGEHADVPLNEHAGAQVAELIATGNRSCLIDLGGWMVGERTRFFIAFASTFFKLSRGKRHLVIDEVHNFAPQGRILDIDAGKMLHWANRLASEGSGKGITLIAASQRPQKVHKDFVTSCETLIACRVIHKLDRDAIKDWIDGCADPLKGKEVLQQLATMQRPEAWIWSPEIEYGPERVTFPMFKTYDSFKPQAADLGKLKGWADVDLDDVKSKLQSVVQEAQANDPATLKRRIAELERQAKQQKPAPAAAIDTSKLQQDAWADGRATGRAEITDQLEVYYGSLEHWAKDMPKPPVFKISLGGLPARLERHTPSRPAPQPVRRAQAKHVDSSLGAPRQKILDQLAWLESLGLYPAPKETLAAVCDVSPTSGGYFNNLGALRSAGLIDYPQPGMVGFTDTGRAAANVPEMNGKEIHEHWLSIVTTPQRAILEALIDKHPNPVSKDDLAGTINVSPTSGGYFNNLGRLRTLGAIDYPSPGQVHLTRYVMP